MVNGYKPLYFPDHKVFLLFKKRMDKTSTSRYLQSNCFEINNKDSIPDHCAHGALVGGGKPAFLSWPFERLASVDVVEVDLELSG